MKCIDCGVEYDLFAAPIDCRICNICSDYDANNLCGSCCEDRFDSKKEEEKRWEKDRDAAMEKELEKKWQKEYLAAMYEEYRKANGDAALIKLKEKHAAIAKEWHDYYLKKQKETK